MRNRVDDSGVNLLDDLFLHYLSHGMSNPPLVVYYGLTLVFHWYTMSAKGWANTFEIINRISNQLPMFFQ
jgi:hypothetical protein